MVDDARGHEQRGFECRVIEDVEYRRHSGQRAIETQQQRDQAEVADGRISQQTFEIVLEHRAIGAEQQRTRTSAADDVEPFFAAGQRRPQTREQENPGLDHGRRMQIGRNRSRRRHCVGQPEVERELGALLRAPMRIRGRRIG